MKTVQTIVSIGLGLFIAFIILSYAMKPVVTPKVSTFTLDPWPLSLDDSNLALIGVGLESRAPAPPSVMDASPAASAKPVMMASVPQAPMPMGSSTVMAAPHFTGPMMAPSPSPVMMMAPSPAMPVSSTMTPAPSA